MKQFKIGIVHSTQATDLNRIYAMLQPFGTIRYLSPNPMDIDYSIDVVIMPSAGINPNLQCFIHEDGLRNIPISPLCPFVERFREMCLPLYMQGDISIVGVGDSSAILWDVIKQKVSYTSLGNMLIAPKGDRTINIIGKNDIFIEAFSKDFGESAVLAGFDKAGLNFGQFILNLRNRVMDEAADMLRNDSQSEPPEEASEYI